MPREEIPNDHLLKLQSFVDVMKEIGIYGNEFTQVLWSMLQTSYFGNAKFDKTYLGKLSENKQGEKSYTRSILLMPKIQDEKSEYSNLPLYLLDTSSLNIEICKKEDIIDKLKSKEFVFENEKYTLPILENQEVEHE